MRISRVAVWAFIIVVALAYPAGPVWATAPTYKAIDLTPAGFSRVYAWGVGGGKEVGMGYVPATDTWHALVWSGTAASVVDLTPSNGREWAAFGTNGIQQVGYGYGPTSQMHAMLWSGSGSATDLNPAGFSSSKATAVSQTVQVGYGYSPSGQYHPLVWSGTAASARDLCPSAFPSSWIDGTDGTHHIGAGNSAATNNRYHALLWTGTSTNAVDLNPAGYIETVGKGVAGNQQVGYGSTPSSGLTHALLWTGTAQSYVDLGEGYGYATNGTKQVGIHGGSACVWNGTAASVVNLAQFLPSGLRNSGSSAWGIDEQGNIVGYAYDLAGNEHAILWEPEQVPEPATLTLLTVGGLMLLRRKRK